MTGTQPFKTPNTPNRRRSPIDRRQHPDRRTHALPNQHAAEENTILNELLRDAHARIRVLERAIERLTGAI